MELTPEIQHILLSYEAKLNQVVNSAHTLQDWNEYMQLTDLIIGVGIQ